MPRLIAEWEPQSAVLIIWPHSTGDFGERIVDVEQTYLTISRLISAWQLLLIVHKNEAHQRHIIQLLKTKKDCNLANTMFIAAPYNDIWSRDIMPIACSTENGIRLLNFQFNGWGSKYNFTDDNGLADQLIAKGVFRGAEIQQESMVLEGGSIETDGQGTLLTTKQCLLNPNRNPDLSPTEIKQRLKQLFGIRRVLWLDQGNLAGDDTDAHVDTLVRFCSHNTIAYTCCRRENDDHYPSLLQLKKQVTSFKTLADEPYHLIPLPLPNPIYDDEERQLPANYANFLIINDAVLVPVYEDVADRIALQRLGAAFPTRQILPVPCRSLIQQYGSLHCMTMQFPEGSIQTTTVI